jgi:hypothetical protein
MTFFLHFVLSHFTTLSVIRGNPTFDGLPKGVNAAFAHQSPISFSA